MDERPNLDKKISVQDFKDFYWLKKELVEFCKTVGLRRSGGKVALAQRIEFYLQTRKIPVEKAKKTAPKKSKFDWKKETLTVNTRITDNYQNSENVRAFFETKIGKHFKFNVVFMNWMKTNEGKTLQDAIEKWSAIHEAKKINKQPKKIAPQFEYNTYLRDFLADNPNENRVTGIKLWKIKKSKRGDNVYRKSDLNWL